MYVLTDPVGSCMVSRKGALNSYYKIWEFTLKVKYEYRTNKTTNTKFSDDRNWDSFHNPKNLVMALNGEVGELK